MYTVKEKKKNSFYRDYTPMFPKYQDTELEVYIAHSIEKDVSKGMKAMVRCISAMVVRGLSYERGMIDD